MPWDKRLFGTEQNLVADVAEKAKILFKNPIEKNKLYNWYVGAVNELPLNKGILFCQKENIYWDRGLRRKYKCIYTFCIVIMISIVIFIGVIINESVEQLFCRIAFVAPLLYWLHETIKSLNSDIIRLDKLYNSITDDSLKTMDDLQDIQKDIYEHRKSGFSIPNWFYQKFKNQDEAIMQSTVEIEKRYLK